MVVDTVVCVNPKTPQMTLKTFHLCVVHQATLLSLGAEVCCLLARQHVCTPVGGGGDRGGPRRVVDRGVEDVKPSPDLADPLMDVVNTVEIIRGHINRRRGKKKGEFPFWTKLNASTFLTFNASGSGFGIRVS
jgi:hypothetical protein